MIIDDIWEGAYKGLYGEVVTEDIYRIRQLNFIPDVIFDLGANVGTFSRFARELFPSAVIVAVEPDKDNVEYFFQFNNPIDNNIVLHNMAIGQGNVYRCTGAVNGAHESYISNGLGFENAKEDVFLQKVEVKTSLLDFIVNGWIREGQKYMIKIDIEGNETALFSHEPSMNALRNAHYIAMELHYHALEGNMVEIVKDFTLSQLDTLKETHNIEHVHPMFYATKKC